MRWLLGVGFEDNEDQIAEVKTLFTRKFGKLVVKREDGKTETLRNVNKWTAKFIDETKEEFVNPNFADILKNKIVVDYDAWNLNVGCDDKEDEYAGDQYMYDVKHFTPSGAFRKLEYKSTGRTLDHEGTAADKIRYEYYKKIADDRIKAEDSKMESINQNDKLVRGKMILI